jgi:hypothetical protein
MARTVISLSARAATLGAFASLAVQALWAVFCLAVAPALPPDNWLVSALGILMAGVVMSTLALIGTALALLAVSGPSRSGWAVAALILNALVSSHHHPAAGARRPTH